MMLKKLVPLALAAMITLNYCGGGDDKEPSLSDKIEAISKMDDVVKSAEKSQDEAKKRYEARKAKGDTLAMNFKELQKFLPSSVSGFQASEPEGSTTNMAGYSMSNAEIKFTNAKNETITVQILDYNAAYDAWAGITAWTQVGYSTENSDGYTKTIDLGAPHVYAYATYNKPSNNSSVFMAVGYRFYVTIEGDNVSMETISAVARSMKLKELGSL